MRLQVRLAQTLVPLAMATMLVTGCGSTEDADGGSGGTATATTDPQAAALDFARCMRENGVDIPDPKAPGNGDDKGNVVLGPGSRQDPKFAAAHKACERYAKDLGGFGPGGGITEEDKQRMVEFATCMREHGVDMPDPSFEGGGGAINLPGPSDPRGQAAFEKAQKACGTLFGRGPDGGSS